MKCMKCGKPVDDLSYYCKSCRGEFYLPARVSEHEDKPAHDISLDTGSLLGNLTKVRGQNGFAAWKQMISYMLLKHRTTKKTAEHDAAGLE